MSLTKTDKVDKVALWFVALAFVALLLLICLLPLVDAGTVPVSEGLSVSAVVNGSSVQVLVNGQSVILQSGLNLSNTSVVLNGTYVFNKNVSYSCPNCSNETVYVYNHTTDVVYVNNCTKTECNCSVVEVNQTDCDLSNVLDHLDGIRNKFGNVSRDEKNIISSVNHEVDNSFKDQQSWFENTFLPTSNDLRNCKDNLRDCELRESKHLVNQSGHSHQLAQKDSVIDSCERENDRMTWAVVALLLFAGIMILYIASSNFGFSGLWGGGRKTPVE